MVENTVVKEALTDQMIQTGAEIVLRLDASGISVPVALWVFLRENNEWRLFLVSPDLDTRGPREVYRRIEQAREDLGMQADQVPLSSIGVLSPANSLAHLFRGAARTGPGISRIRLSKNVINGHYVDDALIYRNAA